METILANLPMALCLLLGMGLIIVEVFLPGFGLPGVAGIALVGVGTIMAAMHFGTLTAAALREGKLGVMDYYEMKNTIADTAMRDSIASMGEGANAPRKK